MGGVWVLIVFLERLEYLAALAHRPDIAGAICHLAVSLGMFGPCLN
jgi:hypothetical protein